MKNIATQLLKDLRCTHTPLEQGWDIFDVDSTGVLEIEAVSEANVFGDDDMKATNHVIKKAIEGDVDALKALLIIMATIAEPVITQASAASGLAFGGGTESPAQWLKLKHTFGEKAAGTASRATH